MVNEVLNASDVASNLWESMKPLLLDKVSPLVTIFKAVGIAILIYVAFLIIRALFRWKSTVNIGKISKNVQDINNKLDLLIGKNKKEIIKKKKREKNKLPQIFNNFTS